MNSQSKSYTFDKSAEFFKRALESVPAQCHTLSHGPTQYVANVSPRFLDRGEGCYVWDVDGNKFLDLAPGGFPAILGYNNEEFNQAVGAQLRKGLLFPMPSHLEVEVAEQLIKYIPCADRVKFAKNGSDVTTMAIRLARAVTGRKKIATGGYHGYHDWYIGTTNRTRGIPEEVRNLTLTFTYNDFESLERVFIENEGQIAAVIMEPVQLSPPRDNFLEKVKALASKKGALLVFDEIITGFRFSLGGAQEYFGVIPDLAAFGKALGNGMPISALVGRKEYMEHFSFEGVFFSSTFGGECASLAGAAKTIEMIQKYKVIEHVWNMGDKLKEGFNARSRQEGVGEYLKCIGYAPWTDVEIIAEGLEFTDLELKSLFQQECMRRGLLAGLYHAPCWAHKEQDIKLALEIYQEAMCVFKKIVDEGKVREKLEGEPVRPVFRMRE